MKEIDANVIKITSNDWDPEAANLIKRNFAFNDIPESKTEVTAMDAIDLMWLKRKEKEYYDVIDLDPYGTAVPFLDSTIQAVENGGLLWITFTDTAVLWGSKPHALFYRYGSVNTHKKNCHEFALRLVLHTIATTANRYQKQIIPLMSLTVDFYIRLFIKVVWKPIMWHESILNTSLVFQWNSCQCFYLHSFGKTSDKSKKKRVKIGEEQEVEKDDVNMTESQKQSIRDSKHNTKFTINNFSIPEKWDVWDSSFMIAGPIWSGEIHDREFVNSLLESVKNWKHLKTHKRIKETLQAIQLEMTIGNYPLSYDFDRLIWEIKWESISRKAIFSAFKSLNYQLVQTYYKPQLYKTNASPRAVYDIFKAWKQKKIEGTKRSLTSKWSGSALTILAKPIEFIPDFEYQPEEIDQILKDSKIKYNSNPPNWGPGSRAKNKKASKKADEKEEEKEDA